ncbi:MAG: T9SS type A sorting domain-containing protein [Balneola sp.]
MSRIFFLLLIVGCGTYSSPSFAQSSLSDDFETEGELTGFIINNESALPDVVKVDGRYRANLIDNANNVTLHFNQNQGRLDAKLVTFPFEFIARNIGIGTQEDSQTAPAHQGNEYIFSGVQVHALELAQPNSSHVVVGQRGPTGFTIEGKNTLNGSSSVNDAGANIVPDGRADIRIVGETDNTITVYWQLPNQQQDNWTLYNNTGELPGTAPTYSDSVYVGLITYAFELNGVPFVGTCDGIEVTSNISVSIDEELDNDLDFELKQNYPNPFNPTTTISFTLENSSIVVLEVFDLKGQIVTVLENKTLTSGSHEYVFDAGFLASGTYYYSLKVDGKHSVKKILLVK